MTTFTNPVFTHPGQPQMQAEVILASQSPVPEAPVIYTIRLRYPRIIHGEIMTHRVFSRNARSSRAVPVKTMLNEVRIIPFVPWHWGKNQKGMQAGESFNEHEIKDFQAAWLNSAQDEARKAELLMNWGIHKQIPNRLLEPFSWIDTLITSTDWDNFLWLRDHADAEPHLQDLARLVKQAIDNAHVQTLGTHVGWHLPYIRDQDYDWAYYYVQDRDGVAVPDRQERAKLLCKISAARCARISYTPFDGDPSYERELERYNSLVTADRVHASPLEHQATPDGQWNDMGRGSEQWNNPHLHGNFTGWIQARKLVPNERYKAPV